MTSSSNMGFNVLRSSKVNLSKGTALVSANFTAAPGLYRMLVGVYGKGGGCVLTKSSIKAY